MSNNARSFLQDLDEGDSSVIHHNFIQSALTVLVPTLLEQLLKQEDDQDREDTAWNLSMAAGTCLDLIATVVEDNIVSLVMPFVQVVSHSSLACYHAISEACVDLTMQTRIFLAAKLQCLRISSRIYVYGGVCVQSNIERKTTPEDWRYREAATFAFGSILEGPSAEKLVPIVNQGLPFFLNALKDNNSQVRHTTAWTIGKDYLKP